ncbi:MAG: rubredoxin, partial [Clostridia bacterium]
MAKYRCIICGYIYDEEKEGVKFEDLPDDWKCPMCFSPKSMFKLIEEENSNKGKKIEVKKEAKGPENKLENYLKEYSRESDEIVKSMSDIHTMAITGKSIISAMGTKLPVTSWNDILILGGQLNKMPLLDDEEVSLKTVI